jgi:hypothetical protein
MTLTVSIQRQLLQRPIRALRVTSGNHSFALEPLLLKSENDIYFVTV